MISIVGGTYLEQCFEPFWNERYGSGLRACYTLHALKCRSEIDYYTFADQQMAEHLNLLSSTLLIKNHITPIKNSIQFVYEHPLSDPKIYPRPDTLVKSENIIKAIGENILYYGLLEGNAIVNGKNVVYDPQSPVAPIAFSKTGSTAEKLAYVVNLREASLLSGKNTLEEIRDFFFQVEKTTALVLKMGPRGALVFTETVTKNIPVYKTPNVWPIGSGDVFAAVFAYIWFQNLDAIQAAEEASWQTACYCNTRDFQFCAKDSQENILPLLINNFPNKQVYLAGPFFTFSERWLIDQIYRSLRSFNLNVFSPWHDVGLGIASDVVSKDIDALDHSGIIFAVLDGLDSGTLFEIGYGVKMGIPIVGYVENESAESIKMLEGTACILEKDLTTSIYKCFWALANHE